MGKIPDNTDDIRSTKDIPSWKRMCYCILKNDHTCRFMGFGMTRQQQKRIDLIREKYDGYTMPVVCYYAKSQDVYVIVDGFHRYRVMKEHPDIYVRISGMPTICSTTITTSCMISITRPVSRSPRCGWRPPLTIIPKTLSI